MCREAGDGQGLPAFIDRAFERYLSCGRLEKGLVRVYCQKCRKSEVVAFSCKTRGLCPSCDGRRMTEVAAHLVDEVIPEVPIRQWVLSLPYDLRYMLAWNLEMRKAVFAALQRAVDAHYRRQGALAGVKDPKTGAIAVIQRFNSALQTDVHIHVLYADGVWENDPANPVFTPAPPLETVVVQEVLWDAWLRIERQLKKFGWHDKEQDTLPERDPALAALLKAAVQGRQITGNEAGKPLRKERGAGLKVPMPHGRNCAEFAGYSLHANTRVGELAREQLERLVRYVCRPAIAAGRIEAVDDDHERITLKTTWKDGTSSVIVPMDDLVIRMAAQVPLPRRANLKYGGVFAPNSKLRAAVVPAGDKPKCGRKHKHECAELDDHARERETSTRLTWAEAFKRAFRQDLLTCPCGGRRVVLAAVQDKAALERILRHIGLWCDSADIEAIRGPPEDLWPAEPDLAAPYDDLPPIEEAA